jgi:hypothetical protein
MLLDKRHNLVFSLTKTLYNNFSHFSRKYLSNMHSNLTCDNPLILSLQHFTSSGKKLSSSTQQSRGGVGYRKYAGDALWLPRTQRPAWLDGSLPGDRGFDPLGLSKPVEYLQFDLDELDQNKSVNRAGIVVGTFQGSKDEVSSE